MRFLTEQIDQRDARALDRLLRVCAHRGMVAIELGTYTGRSSMVMLTHIKRMDGTLYCVDWFQGNPGVHAEITTSYQEDDILHIFLSNVKEGGYERHVNVLVGTTDRVADVIADGIADFIFIDADHRYTQVQRDILKWYPKLKPNGILCGHDFDRHLNDCDYRRLVEHCEEDFVDGCHYGVVRAVCEFFPDVQWEGRVWYVRKDATPRPRLSVALAEWRRPPSAAIGNGQELPSAPSLPMRSKAVTVHKYTEQKRQPMVSVILLDWSVRERFQALEWLGKQDVPRDQYELIWVELYDRVIPEAIEQADTVITCGQRGMYHKHVGYNIGLLHARGSIVTVCDSDAVFPTDFIRSILETFNMQEAAEPQPLVLMHYERRTKTQYPKALPTIADLQRYEWLELWPNVGACVSVRRADAIRFGGFDEHPSFRGYLCGPYDLAWRLVNAGILEVWHEERVTLWHFAHPDPPASFGQPFSWRLWWQMAHPHIDRHALTAVEAFATGRLLPLRENPDVHSLRMLLRQIGTSDEEQYARITCGTRFSSWKRFWLHITLIVEPIRRAVLGVLRRISPRGYEALRDRWRFLRGKKHSASGMVR